MESTGLKELIELRLDILRPIDVKFVTGMPQPTICVLYEDNRHFKHFKTYYIDPKDKEFGNIQPAEWTQKSLDVGAKFVVPLPSPMDGVLIVG